MATDHQSIDATTFFHPVPQCEPNLGNVGPSPDQANKINKSYDHRIIGSSGWILTKVRLQSDHIIALNCRKADSHINKDYKQPWQQFICIKIDTDLKKLWKNCHIE